MVSLFSVHRQRAVLELFVTGSHSSRMEALEEDEVKAHVTHLLRRVSGQDVPEPTFFRRCEAYVCAMLINYNSNNAN